MMKARRENWFNPPDVHTYFDVEASLQPKKGRSKFKVTRVLQHWYNYIYEWSDVYTRKFPYKLHLACCCDTDDACTKA